VGLFKRSGRDLRAGNHPLKIELVDAESLTTDSGQALSRCHLVFFTESAREQALQLLSRPLPRRLLITGEVDGFCQRGGMVGFSIHQGRVNIIINPGVLSSYELRVSAEFMQHATLVDTSESEVD